jgi:Domain of unknown function (DUF4386)
VEQIVERSPRPNPRTVGVIYLLYFLTAFFGAYLMKGIVVRGDAATTATRMLAHEATYRSGFAVSLIANAMYIALTVLFYELFRQVDRRMSLLAAFFSLVGCTVQISGGILQLAPFVFLGDRQWLSAFTVEQLQAAALLCLRLYAQAFSIALVMFALYDLLLGYLIFKSMFLPRFVGVVMMLAGVGWLTFVWPPLSTALSAYVLPFGALAEVLLMLCLLVRGPSGPGPR